MNEKINHPCESYKLIKPFLSTGAAAILQKLNEGINPSQTLCEQMKDNLEKYQKRMQECMPNFFERYDVTVEHGCLTGIAFSTEELTKDLEQHPDMLNILSSFCLAKLQKEKLSPGVAPELQFLLKHQYIAPVTIRHAGHSYRYLTLTSKGWSSFDPEILEPQIQLLFQHEHASIPKSTMMDTEDWTDIELVKAAALAHYFDQKKLRLMAFSYPSQGELMIGCKASMPGTIHYVCPAFFDTVPTKRQIEQMQALVDLPEMTQIDFLIPTREDAIMLMGWLKRFDVTNVGFEIIEKDEPTAEQMLKFLSQGRLLTVRQCDTLMQALDTWRQENTEKVGKFAMQETQQDDKQLNKMVSIFTQLTDHSKAIMTEILDTISGGRVPEETEMQLLDDSIKTMRGLYQTVYRLAHEQLLEEELPPEGSPIQEYSEAVTNSQILKYHKLLEKLQGILETFVSVRSLVDAYTEALSPYQAEAAELICKLKSGAVSDLDSVSEEIKGPELFLQALNVVQNDSEENVDQLEELEDHLAEYYSRRVQNGLLRNKYFIAPVTDTEKQNEILEKPDSTSQKGVQDQEPETALPISEELEEEPDQNQEPEESEWVQAVKASGVLMESDEIFGTLESETAASASRKISASIFVNDMHCGNKRTESVVMKELGSKGMTTAEYLTKVYLVPQAQYALEDLFRKGYLQKQNLSRFGTAYLPTDRLVHAMAKKESCRYLDIRANHFSDMRPESPKSIRSTAARWTLVRVGADSISRLSDKAPNRQESCSISDEAFHFHLSSPAVDGIGELIIGVFWSNTSKCDDFFESLKELLQSIEPPCRVIFAGADAGHARITADLILSRFALQNSQIFLYSLTDDCYFSYPEGEPMSIDKTAMLRSATDTPDTQDTPDAPDVQNVQEDSLDQESGHMSVTVSSQDPDTETVEPEVISCPEEPVDSAEALIVPERHTKEQSEDFPDSVDEKHVSDYRGPDEATRNQNLFELFSRGQFYAAATYARACALADPAFLPSCRQLSYAINDPMEHCIYSSDKAFDLFAENTPFGDALNVATAIRTFFSNQIRYDYGIKSLFDGIKNNELLERFPELGKIVYALMEFKDTYQKGMVSCTGRHARNREVLDQEIRHTQREAAEFYENFVLGRKRETASLKRFLLTKQLIFSQKSDIGDFMKGIAEGTMELQELLGEFLQQNFFREDSVISDESIDSDLLWGYIVGYWEKAGDQLICRKNTDLMSSLRTNITNQTTKAIQILSRWYVLSDQKLNRTEDAGACAYQKMAEPMLVSITRSVEALTQAIQSPEMSLEQTAGLNILRSTLTELQSNMEGSIDDKKQSYFYAPFLLTDYIPLNEAFTPEFETFGSGIAALDPCARILAHAEACSENELDYKARLDYLLQEQGDDCGTARLLAKYIQTQDTAWNSTEVMDTIDQNEAYAKERAQYAKADFIGELELAQSYGQIDNSKEDVKEKILQIVDSWYGWANSTSNYGFFRKVLDAYLSEIRENARAREAGLLEQLKAFRETNVVGLSVDAKNQRIARIEQAIGNQNYTVAEDLLARASSADEETDDVIDEDFLQDFLEHYDDYYQPVSSNRTTLASLIRTRIRNKQGRGAQKLVDNWLPGGGLLGPERLRNLLSGLGFQIGSLAPQPQIGKYENFVVRTASANGSMRNHFTHPIAAFGSGAIQNGFRVVCLNGVYDADGLIDVMKQIGNTKHTLILLDCALSMGERRRLARKTKTDLGDKLFIVLDRTVMMFLIRNYDETKINRMLISLVTPFGYYQPYVWESANVMPPEIFIGRKRELERIKSPEGTNIVYGGRQLGKSALLKKAREDIDRNENNDRAVYMEIKGLDYHKAAQKIAHELYDQGILEEDLQTNDWDVLARAIKKRLQSKTHEIPYLLLLLDEADTFIESCEAVNYQPFDALKEIQSVGRERFKFVVAGLRNIVRFKREAALSNNSVLTHLESMTVKPFNPVEARELMELPLHYLGLRFPREKESLVTLILATTNYFPGLIQMYCAKLLEAMRSQNYAGYDEANTPIYEVSEDHIKKVLSDPEFTKQIREKFVITLKLDEDNYYYLIALIMAYLYHTNGYNEGYTAEEIHQAGLELGVGKISRLEKSKLSAFMEELRELNVLRSTDENHYLFTRFTFFQMMGTSSEVDDKLMEYMED